MGKATKTTGKKKNDSPLAVARLALAEAYEGAKKDTPEGKLPSVKWRIVIEDALREVAKQELLDRFGHKRGTPETLAKIHAVPMRRREGALSRMWLLGKISADELAAACEIAEVAEMIERGVSMRAGALEARVDGSGSGRDVLVESMGRIRAEVTYTAWRQQIPIPRAMILDMVVRDKPYVAAARAYGLNYRTARKRLMSSLRLWNELREAASQNVTDEVVEDAYRRLGEGFLARPLPQRKEEASSR